MRECPRCGGETSENARFCGHCAFDLSAQPLRISLSEQAPQPRVCPRCGTTLGNDAKFCANCAAPVNPEGRRKRAFLIFLIASVLFVAGVATVIILISSSGSVDPASNLASRIVTSVKPTRSISEFRSLKVAQGDYLFGYKNVANATDAAEVIRMFGNPSKSQELNDFYKCKVFYYEAKDDFGNSCFAKLQFANCCRNKSGELGCHALIAVGVDPR